MNRCWCRLDRSTSHRKRVISAYQSVRSVDRIVHSSSSNQLEKLTSETHVTNEGEDSGGTWNESRSYSHSLAFEVPAGNMFQFFADLESSRPICDLHQFFGTVSF